MILLYRIIIFTTSIGSWLLGFFVYRTSPKKKPNRMWFILCLAIGIWSFGYAFSTTLKILDKDYLLAVSRISHSVGALIPAFLFHFAYVWIKMSKLTKRALIACYCSCIVVSLLTLTPFVVIDLVPKMFLLYYPVGRIGYLIYSVNFIFWGIYVHYFLFRGYKKTVGFERSQLQYLLIGSAVGFFGGAACFPLVFGIKITPYPTVLILVYLITTTYSIVRYRLMDIRIAVTRAGIFLFVYTFVLGVPFLLGYKYSLWQAAIWVMFILATAGPLIYRKLKAQAESIILAKQKYYQNLLLQAGEGMIYEHNITKLLKLIVYMVKRIVGIQYVTAFAQDSENLPYTLKALRDHNDVPTIIELDNNCDLINLIKNKKSPLMPQEIPQLQRKYLEEKLKTTFDLIVPSMGKDGLSGFLVLGEKLDKSIYTQDDINMFKILAQQSSLAIENCKFFDKFKDAQAKVAEAEKLATIGGMSAGIAHQFRNRLNVFASVSMNMSMQVEEGRSNGLNFSEEQLNLFNEWEKMADILNKEVIRCKTMIDGVVKFSREQQTETDFSLFPLKEVIDSAMWPFKLKHHLVEKDLPFELILGFDVNDCIYGIRGNMNEVILNHIDNAYESVQEKRDNFLKGEEKENYKPFIKIELEIKNSRYLIKISDNGMGIKKEDRMKIFAPFFTTKISAKSGKGIGMYVIRRMIEESHKGKIRFESDYPNGAVFFIDLPKKNIGSKV